MQALAGLTRLRSLNLAAHAGLTSEGLDFLAACSHLTALDLSSEFTTLLSRFLLFLACW